MMLLLLLLQSRLHCQANTTTATTTTTTTDPDVCDGGGQALTPALYLAGYDAFQNASCINDRAFCRDALDGSDFARGGCTIVLEDLDHLKYIGEQAFYKSPCTVTMKGSFLKFADIRESAFASLSSSSSSVHLDGDLVPALGAVEAYAFAGFRGIVTIRGTFNRLTHFETGVFYGHGKSNSRSIVDIQGGNALETIGWKVFQQYRGYVSFQGSFPSLTTIGSASFYAIGNAESVVDIKEADALVKIGSQAFHYFKGRVSFQGAFPSLTTISKSAFGSMPNVGSVVAIVCRGPTWTVGGSAFGGFSGTRPDDAKGEGCYCYDCAGVCSTQCVATTTTTATSTTTSSTTTLTFTSTTTTATSSTTTTTLSTTTTTATSSTATTDTVTSATITTATFTSATTSTVTQSSTTATSVTTTTTLNAEQLLDAFLTKNPTKTVADLVHDMWFKDGKPILDLFYKGFTLQELYDGGVPLDALQTAADLDEEASDLDHLTYERQLNKVFDSLESDKASSAVIIATAVAVLVFLVVFIFIYRRCRQSRNLATSASTPAYTTNPAFSKEAMPTSNDGDFAGVVQTVQSTSLPPTPARRNDSRQIRIVSAGALYEAPSVRQSQLYDEGKVPGANINVVVEAAYAEIDEGNTNTNTQAEEPVAEYDVLQPGYQYASLNGVQSHYDGTTNVLSGAQVQVQVRPAYANVDDEYGDDDNLDV